MDLETLKFFHSQFELATPGAREARAERKKEQPFAVRVSLGEKKGGKGGKI